MKYYILTWTVNKKVIGYYPQTVGNECIDENGDLPPYAKGYITNEEFPDQLTNFNFEMHKRAKLTDLVDASNISARGLLVSEKMKNIISEFNILNHKFYPANLEFKGETLRYYWLHIVNTTLEGIDFLNSNFIEVGYTRRKEKDVEINSHEEYDRITCDMMIDCDKIVLQPSFKEYDLFFFPCISSDLFASERLINALKANKITGIEIEESDICDE